MVLVHGEWTEGAAGNTNPAQPVTAEERAYSGATTGPAREGMHDNPPRGAPETEDILASIFDEIASMAAWGPPTDAHLIEEESFEAFMASCRDGTKTTGPATTSAPRHTAQRGELAAPTRDLASASDQAHLRRNYATLGPMAAVHTTATEDDQAGRRP